MRIILELRFSVAMFQCKIDLFQDQRVYKKHIMQSQKGRKLESILLGKLNLLLSSVDYLVEIVQSLRY